MSILSSKIKTALVQGYLTAMEGLNVPVMLDNRAFTPPDGAVHATSATGWVEFATPPLAGATVSVNGTVYTASNTVDPVPPLFYKSLAGFLAAVNATTQGTPHPDVVATASGTKSALSARLPGLVGNLLTLSASSLPISGAFLAGGTLGSVWTKVSHVPGGRFASTLGASGEDTVTGFLQVDVNVPLDTGEVIQSQVLDVLEEYFTSGRALTHGGVVVNVTGNQLSLSRREDNWHRRSITVYYRAHLQRPPLT
jgi:hypothetical protein